MKKCIDCGNFIHGKKYCLKCYLKNHNPVKKGVKITWGDKISDSIMKNPVDIERRRIQGNKMRFINTGKKRTKKARKKYSQNLTKNWQDPEFRDKRVKQIKIGNLKKDMTKVKERMLTNNPMNNQKIRKKHLKIMRSERMRKIKRENAQERWNDENQREKWIKSILKILFKRPTKLEKGFINFFDTYNVPFNYCGNGSLIIGGKCPDFVESNGKKICLEVGNKREKSVPRKNRIYKNWQEYEQQRISHFAGFGWKCLVLWENELENEVLLNNKIKRWL